MKQVRWNQPAVEDIAKLEKGIVRRIKEALDRLAQGGSVGVNKLQGIDPRRHRVRSPNRRSLIAAKSVVAAYPMRNRRSSKTKVRVALRRSVRTPDAEDSTGS